MSGITKSARSGRLAVRLALVALYLALTAVVFWFGKGHTVVVDNKDAEDGSYAAIDGILVSVDGQEALEMYAGDRDKAIVKGQSHSVTVEEIGGGEKTARKFSLPLDSDMVLLSIPKLLAGIEPACEPFVVRDVSVPAEEAENNEFTSPAAGEAPAAEAPAAP